MYKYIYGVVLVLCLSFLSAFTVLAEDAPGAGSTIKGNDVVETCEQGMTCLHNPIGPDKDLNINVMIGGVINKGLGVVGSIGLLMFVIAGYVMMTSAGIMEKVQLGKKIMFYTALGMIIIFSAYPLVLFVLQGVTGK